MLHELLPAMTDDIFESRDPRVTYTCSCKLWHRTYRQSQLPRYAEVESNHFDHAHRAGAEDLRTGAPRSPQEELERVLRAMARVVVEAAKAAETMGEFIAAHKDAKVQGVGVVVVRQSDGSHTSTPNVFVPAGTAVFIDEPSTSPPTLPGFTQSLPVVHISNYAPRPRTVLESGGLVA